jgi:phosphotransferase system IIB component
MSAKSQALAEQIFQEVKPAGIKSYAMCSTRLRITLEDYAKVNLDNIKAFKGVIDAVVADDHLQVVMGVGDVVDVYSAFKKLA